MTSYADRQKKYRDRKKAKGLIQFRAWVTPETAEKLRIIADEYERDT